MTSETIRCASCGTHNRPGRRFCRSCGAELGAACPVCGTVNEAGDRFCGACGSDLGVPDEDATAAVAARTAGATTTAGTPPITPPGAGLTLERRLVSVLFADLVGSTAMAEGQDVEAVRDLLARYYDLCREIVDRYGGAIEKFIGDAVMAMWGAPVAREDDAERAVRAGLDLLDAARTLQTPDGRALRMRAAVLTGEAAVTLGAEGQAMVAGDLVNTASRLQSVAPPGAVLVDGPTVRASEAAIDYEAAGDQLLTGKTARVSAWRALRIAARRLGSGRVNRLEPPFVGRDDELRLLKEVFHQTARERRPRLVSITGIAGIGKSRLAWELEKYMDGVVETVYWHRGRSPAYGDGLAFWALGEMVRRRARIAETDDPETARRKLGDMAVEYLADPEERRRVEPRLAALLGLEPAPTGGAEELTGAWRTLFERIADLGPTVLVFEDLHWADSALLDFIESLLGGARSKPILVLALARPELMASRPTWGAAVRNHLRLDLAPLDDASMELLLLGLAPGIPPGAIAAIRARAEGIPLYAVETVRMLLDQGRVTETDGRFRLVGDLSGLAVPGSLLALLGARLDALDPEARDLVGHCAVLGVTFTVASVAALAGRDEQDVRAELDGLVERELFAFDDDPRSPERGQYHFLQGVLREVAYGRLSRKERQARHLAAARAFEAAGADELAGVVATHYLEAVRVAPDDDAALRARALEALRAAATRSHSVGAYAGAARYLQDALELAGDDVERLVLREARLHELYEANDVEAVQVEARALLEIGRERGDDGLTARAAYALAGGLVGAGRVADALESVAGVCDSLGPFAIEDPDGLRLTAELARCQLMAGMPVAAGETIERTLPVVERLGLRDVVAELLPSKGWALGASGRPLEAIALHRGALVFAEQDGPFRAEMRARMNLSAVAGWEVPREAYEVTRVGIERARQRGYDLWAISLAGNACGFAVLLGEWDWVIRTVDELGLDDREGPWDQGPLGSLADILAYRGRLEDAGRIVDRIESLTGALGDPQLASALEAFAGHLAFAGGDLGMADMKQEAARRPAESLGLGQDPGGGLVALERRDVPRLRALAGSTPGGRLGDAFVAALAAGADVLEGDRSAFDRVDAAIALQDEAGMRFLAAMLRRARAMLAPDDPDAGAVALSAISVLRELGAVTMFRGLEPWLDEGGPTAMSSVASEAVAGG